MRTQQIRFGQKTNKIANISIMDMKLLPLDQNQTNIG